MSVHESGWEMNKSIKPLLHRAFYADVRENGVVLFSAGEDSELVIVIEAGQVQELVTWLQNVQGNYAKREAQK